MRIGIDESGWFTPQEYCSFIRQLPVEIMRLPLNDEFVGSANDVTTVYLPLDRATPRVVRVCQDQPTSETAGVPLDMIYQAAA